MKKHTLTMIGALVFSSLFAFSTARAQSTNRSMTANVPFDFSVGNQTLPAGEYTLRVTNPTSARAVVLIRSLDGRRSVMLQMYSVIGKKHAGARLVFNRYDENYFLAQAWTAADSIGMEAGTSRTERAAGNKLAGNIRTIETVALNVKKN